MTQKTKPRRHKISLSLETMVALREAMEDHLKDEPKSKWSRDYKQTITHINRVITKHNKETKENGHEQKT